MRKPNKTFHGDSPIWANACVGINGSPGYWEYSKGFSRSANLLIDAVIKDGGITLLVDELVYPACFNMRHSVELRLKLLIYELQVIYNIKGEELDFNYAGSHDIGQIWEFFTTCSELADERYKAANDRIHETIVDIAEIDATGQTFRYPATIESKRHLTGITSINFIVLKKQFAELEDNLDALYGLSVFLNEEYSLGTFTKKLSRNKLFEIANMLPKKRNWTDHSFDLIKKNVKNKYKIGSKELTDAIKIIKKNYEFSSLIGMQLELAGITQKEVTKFSNNWITLHGKKPSYEEIDIWEDGLDIEKLFNNIKIDSHIRSEIWKEISEYLTREMVSGIAALFYFAEKLDYSERYIEIYESELGSMTCVGDIRDTYFHILNKTNALHNILKSLYFLKHSDLAEYLVKTHSIEKNLSWLDDARSGHLFLKSDYNAVRKTSFYDEFSH